VITIFKQFENGQAFRCFLLHNVMLHQEERKWNVNRVRMLITYIWAPQAQ